MAEYIYARHDFILQREDEIAFVRASASRSSSEMNFIATAGGRCVRSLLCLARRLRLLRLARVSLFQPSPVLMAFSRCNGHALTLRLFHHMPSLMSLHLPR